MTMKKQKRLGLEPLESRWLLTAFPLAFTCNSNHSGWAAQQLPAASVSATVTPDTTVVRAQPHLPITTDAAAASNSSNGALIQAASTTSTIDLSHWSLTLPTGTKGRPNILSTSRLLGGYTSKYFYVGSDGGTVFWSPVNGVKTPGSTYARSELREAKPDGSEYNWKLADGTATLSATLAVNQVPSTGNVVVGQIHDNGVGKAKNAPLIMLLYKFDKSSGTGSLIAQVRRTPTAAKVTNYTVASGINLNTQFSYQIQLRPDDTLSVEVNGANEYSGAVALSWNKQGLYFKAGSYPHDSSGKSSEGGRVSFYALAATHT
jgi:hypothetical protein